MEINDLLLGQVICSIAGRDKGKFLIVVKNIDSQYVKVSDGDLRKIENAKKKKIKHLAKTHHIIFSINKKLENGQEVNNTEIQQSLRKLGYNTK